MLHLVKLFFTILLSKQVDIICPTKIQPLKSKILLFTMFENIPIKQKHADKHRNIFVYLENTFL